MNNNLSLYALEDDDDEEFQWYETRDPYVVQPRIDHLAKWSDKKFRMRFRMQKSTVMFLLGKLDAKLRSPTNRNHAVDPMMKILLALRFYAGGLKLMDAGDLIGVHKSTACHIVREVSHELALLASEFIRMPLGDEEIQYIRRQFYDRARCPRVVGSIDCTHVKIQSPGGILAEVYRCRKGYFSFNVQTVSSTDLRILDIVARYPGSVHDQTIWDQSDVKMKLENGVYGERSLFVGDGGYANTEYVITPMQNPRTEVQQLYNECIIRTRNPVERQYGVLKRRFPVLALGMRLGLQKIQSVIVACAVLHNICIEFESTLPEPPQDPEVPQYTIDDIDDEPRSDTNNCMTARDQLLADYFPSLL